MDQPQWKIIANLGDANPIDHGGTFVFVDETNVHTPQIEVLESVGGETEDEYNEHDELISEGNEKWVVYRFDIDQCTYGKMVNGKWQPLNHYDEEGILSDNQFHPDYPAWFAEPESQRSEVPQDFYLSSVAKYVDFDLYDLIKAFCSNDPLERAVAYKAVADYHGINNIDSYPLTFDSRKEVEKRYEAILKQLNEG